MSVIERTPYEACPLCGSLLHTAQNAGFAISGIDLRQKSVERLAQLGIPARRAALESLREQARYAVISLADVLEHMPFPRPALEHYHNFSRPRLEDVLRQTGFEPLWHYPNDRYLCGLDVAARRIAA
jgi:hypothetical protein